MIELKRLSPKPGVVQGLIDRPHAVIELKRLSPKPGVVQGLRSLDDGFIPPIIDPSVLDRKSS